MERLGAPAWDTALAEVPRGRHEHAHAAAAVVLAALDRPQVVAALRAARAS